MIRVRYFASLAEQLGRREDSVAPEHAATVAEVWHAASGAATLPPNVLSAVNLEYVDAGHAVRDGDEVAFFPPVTGG